MSDSKRVTADTKTSRAIAKTSKAQRVRHELAIAEQAAPEDSRSAWQKQRDDALDAFSKSYAESSTRVFRLTKAEQLADVRLERRTMRQALDTMRRKYERLRADYLKITGTTYATWLSHGPHNEWDEVLVAAMDPAVWDRLVERGLVEDA